MWSRYRFDVSWVMLSTELEDGTKTKLATPIQSSQNLRLSYNQFWAC